MAESHPAGTSRRGVKAESAMKAQAWVSGIDSDTNSSDDAVLSRCPTDDGAQLTEPHSHVNVMPSSLMQQSSVAPTADLPVRLTTNSALVQGTVVENTANPLHSFAVAVTHSAGNAVTVLGTPVKRVDSISASSGHSKTSVAVNAQSVRGPAGSRRLHCYQCYTADGGMGQGVENSQRMEQFNSNFNLLEPQVESVTAHHSNEALDPQKTSLAMQQQTADVAGQLGSWHSTAVVASSAVDHESNNNTKMVYSFSTPLLTAVFSGSSSTQHVDAAASAAADAQHASSLPISLGNARLIELWSRFSQDHTVCTSQPTNSATSLSRIERTESSVENEGKSAQRSKPYDAGKESSYPGSVPVKHAWIVRDETLPAVPEDTTLDSLTSDFTSTSSVDGMGNIVTRTIKRHLPNDPKLLRIQQKIAQQHEKHWKVRKNEQRRKEHIMKMELTLRDRQKAVEQKTADAKKGEGDHRPSPVQLEMNTSSATLTTVTSDDSEVTLCSSLNDDHHSAFNSQMLSASDTSGSCTCQQTHCEMQKVAVAKAREVSLQKWHKSDTAFKPKLSEVRYTDSRATKSAPVLYSKTSSHVLEKNTSTKNVGRKAVTTSTAGRSRIPKSETLKNTQGDRISLSKSAAKTALSKTNSTNRILTERNKHVSADLAVQSKGVQTTPRLRDKVQVSYTNTAVQCPATSSRFDDLGVISVPVASRGQHATSLSSKFYSPDSSSNAEILQKHLKQSLMTKQSVKAHLPREFSVIVSETLLT